MINANRFILAKTSNPFPKRLKEARATYGISQKKLGIAIGIDEFSASARMNQYESGKHAPDYLTVLNIAKFLGYPPSYFYEPNSEIAEFIAMYFNLKAPQKVALLKVIKKLINPNG